MDSEISERIILEIVTNLNTRFVVIPLRSETVGDVRGTIKSIHMQLFPTWGLVDVNALEVKLRGNKCRISDLLFIKDLFWRASKGTIFAELIPLSSSTLVVPPRPNLAGATEPIPISGHKFRQNPAERAPSSLRRGLAEEQFTPDPGASSHRNLRKLGLDQRIVDGRHGHGCKSEVVERQLRTMKRGINVSPCDAGERQIPAERATVEVGEPATKKPCVGKDHPVLEHIGPETGVPTDKHSVKKSLLVVESTTRSANRVRPDSGEQLQFGNFSLPEVFQESGPSLTKEGQEIASSSQDGSRSRSETDHPVAENLPAGPGLGSFKTNADAVRETLKDLGTKHDSSSSDTSDSSTQSGHQLKDKSEEEPGLVISKPDSEGIERNLPAAEASPESSRSQSGTRTGSQNEIAGGQQADKVEVDGLATPERRVPSGGRQNLNGSLEINNKSKHSKGGASDVSTRSSSGGSSDETTKQNEDSGDKGAELQRNHNSSSGGDSSAESDGEEGSRSVRPRECAVGSDSDQTSSGGDSSLQSSEGSESENIESSSDGSDESDQTPPTGRNMDLTTPKDGNGAARGIGRRRLGASVDPKYQHLLDSQNGFDELISLSQLKSKVISGFQQESHVPLADDSLSMDLIPDTQGGDLNGAPVIPEVQEDLVTAEPVEKNIKGTKLSTQESSTVRVSVLQIEEKRAESIQDEDRDRLQFRSGPQISVKLGEASLLLSVKEELISSGGGTTEKTLELEEEPPPQAILENSQQITAALQLARMSVTNGVDSNVQTPSKKRKRRKKGISGPAEAIGDTQSKELLEESIQPKESPISVLFHEEANGLLLPDEKMSVAEGLGNVLPSLEANEVITMPGSVTADESQIGIQFDEEVKSDSDIGRKKQRKRSRKVPVSNTEVPEKDITGYVKSGENEPSQGYLDHPHNASDEAGNKENSGKTPSFEYRDLRKRTNLAIDHHAVEKIMSGLRRDKVSTNLSRNETEGAEEEPAGLQKQQRLTGWVCTLCNSSVPFARQAALISHIQTAHNLEKRHIPRELVQKIEVDTEGKGVENSSRSKKQSKGKKGRVSDQNPNEDPSASLPEEVVLVTDKRLYVHDKEEEEMEVEEDRLVSENKQSNVGEEDEADEAFPVVLNEQKNKSKKVRQSSKSAKMARNMEISLMTDEDGEILSTFAAKTKKRRDKLNVPKKQSEGDVAEEIEQPENPTVVGTDDEQPTDRLRSDGQNQIETSLKTKKKKPKNLDPSVEGRNSEGALLEGHQVEPVDDEDQIATQQSQKVVTNAKQKDIVGKAAKKKSRKKKLQEEVSLHEEDGVSLQTKKVSDAKASDKMTVNSKSKKTSEGKTGDGTKGNANGGFQSHQKCPERCPNGCGREFLKKTSAYYRHLKSCVLGRTPNFA